MRRRFCEAAEQFCFSVPAKPSLSGSANRYQLRRRDARRPAIDGFRDGVVKPGHGGPASQLRGDPSATRRFNGAGLADGLVSSFSRRGSGRGEVSTGRSARDTACRHRRARGLDGRDAGRVGVTDSRRSGGLARQAGLLRDCVAVDQAAPDASGRSFLRPTRVQHLGKRGAGGIAAGGDHDGAAKPARETGRLLRRHPPGTPRILPENADVGLFRSSCAHVRRAFVIRAGNRR